MGQVEVNWTYRKQGGDTTLGKDMLEPVQEDFFQHIYNVQWITGGIFVGADESGNIYYSELRTTKEEEQAGAADVIKTDVKDFHPFDYDYVFSAGAGAIIDGEAVFVLVASYGNRGAEFLEDGIAIMASHDGKNWSIVHDVSDDVPNNPNEPGLLQYKIRDFIGVVYDAAADKPGGGPSKGMFYAVAWTLEQYHGHMPPSPSDTMIGNTLYVSSDGFSWSEAGEELSPSANPGDPPPAGYPSLIEPYCNKPNNEGNIPDGLQGYSYGIDTFVKPEGLTDFDYQGPAYEPNNDTPPSRVEIKVGVQGGIAAGMAPGPANGEVSMPCYAVALAGSAFMAVGGAYSGSGQQDNTAVIDVALAPADPAGPDGTWKWKNVYNQTGKGPIVTAVGLPRSAIKVKIKSDVSGGQGAAPPST